MKIKALVLLAVLCGLLFKTGGGKGREMVPVVDLLQANPQSSTWYVAPDGNDTDSCASPSVPCASINAAIEKATDGDTVKVQAGVYTASGYNAGVYISKGSIFPEVGMMALPSGLAGLPSMGKISACAWR